MRYLTVDGMVSGTGIRNSLEGGYIEPKNLNISKALQVEIQNWLEKYKEAHFSNHKNAATFAKLDNEGLNVAKLLQSELPAAKVEYFSDYKMKRTLIY